MLDHLSELKNRKDVEIYEDVSIKTLSSMRLNASARYLVYPHSAEAFIRAVDICRNSNEKYRVVGRMSNILPSSDFYDGILIKTDKLNKKIKAENKCTAECGAAFSGVVSYMAETGFGGLEKLFHIPASVGGMIYSNAGAYGSEISDSFISAELYDPASEKRVVLGKKEMQFGYRSSILNKSDLVLLSADFLFTPKRREEIYGEIKELGQKRRGTQPLDLPSLGSIFKAHAGVGAGYYIDRAGLKGAAVGGASVSEKHAGFIVNTGNATPSDVLRLIEIVKNRVASLFGIELEEEVQII